MDARNIAERIAIELEARDDVASAVMPDEGTHDAAEVELRTQGGVVYRVYVQLDEGVKQS